MPKQQPLLTLSAACTAICSNNSSAIAMLSAHQLACSLHHLTREYARKARIRNYTCRVHQINTSISQHFANECHTLDLIRPGYYLQVYPSWWGHHAPQQVPQQIRGIDHQPRPAPRLAYSVKQQPQAGKPLHSNDLVTAAYLDVPSSGYTAGRPVSAARRALTWKGAADKPTADSPSAQTGEGKENHSGAQQRWLVIVCLAS